MKTVPKQTKQRAVKGAKEENFIQGKSKRNDKNVGSFYLFQINFDICNQVNLSP